MVPGGRPHSSRELPRWRAADRGGAGGSWLGHRGVLDAVEIGEFDHAAALALRSGSDARRVAGLILERRRRWDGSHRTVDLARLLEEERHAGAAALVAQRAQPRDVTRPRAGAALAAGD